MLEKTEEDTFRITELDILILQRNSCGIWGSHQYLIRK